MPPYNPDPPDPDTDKDRDDHGNDYLDLVSIRRLPPLVPHKRRRKHRGNQIQFRQH